MTGVPTAAGDGLLIVDKPGGWTSHDVVGRVRRLAGTRRVGHAGTLDPMATGVLVIGVGRATRLLGHLTRSDKEYLGTIRLGVTSTTDDADGELRPGATETGWALADAQAAIRGLTGDIAQVPPAYSAISVRGRRAYARARAGESVDLPARQVRVSEFEVLEVRGDDLDVRVVCSAGTYLRALARDLGAALGVGGHLAGLRRTRAGPFGISAARTLDQLAGAFELLSLADAVRLAFPSREVEAEVARGLLHGRPLPAAWAGGGQAGPIGVFGPDGRVLALVQERDGLVRPVCVFG